MSKVRINVTEEIKDEFLRRFAIQNEIEKLRDFSDFVVEKGLKKLNGNIPPGAPPRRIPRANGGNRAIEFERSKNKELIEKLEDFRRENQYISQPWN